MRFLRKGRLNVFWRIYLYGFLLLFTIAFTAGLATHLANVSGQGPKLHSSHQMIARLFTAYVEQTPQGSPELNELLQRLFELTNVSISVFDSDNFRVAYAGNLEVTPLEPDRIKKIKNPRFILWDSLPNTVIPLGTPDDRRGYAMLTWKSGGHYRFFLVAGVVLLMLAVMPWLLARTITVPLRKIAGTTRQIGEGNLAARTGVDRLDEVGLLARDVDTMASRIENLIRSEKTLMANISHEIRTPLARIRVLLELIQEADGPIPREHLEGLKTDVSELDGLLEDVFLAARLDLTMGKPTETGLVMKPEQIDPLEFLSEVVDRFQKQHKSMELVVVTTEMTLPFTADCRLLKRLVANLLDNAVKYSGTDGPVEFHLSRVPNGVMFRVLDCGPGIARTDIEKVFQPFFRGEREPGSGQPGVGIGLSLCRRIVDVHGGTISAINREGGGAEFRVFLPAIL